jgi:hypothetical protein
MMARNVHDIQSNKGAWKTGDIVTVHGVPKYYISDVMPVFGPVLKGLSADIQKECIDRIFLK